ncbi:glycoside hydrolase family 43 protein [Paenibacillus sp. MMS20-IR301]|uniref:glycoside hydrolase family 43 protein n=1 Tax=Paenibacillus sp. MMS20-IR301 TaxID=2895946 RepID=UPI0028F05B52|nr:glycoside hydrolase family 43 protein [Paenibacillus sp. MMS20-IR301]WNS41401.1 glycoside hydrolase family 43 protein [Paenibacillus sp. MMS20-IR301]
MKFINPVIPGFYPDPSICRAGEDYYLVNSTFHYFPGVPVFHSRDLVNWQQIGHCLTRPEQLELAGLESSMGIFAPTLRYHEGYFYMITTLINGRASGGMRNFYVRADHPAGPWSDPVFLDWPGIDPSLFFDEDGRVYITGTNGFSGEPAGIYQAEIGLETGKLLSPRQLIWTGTGGKSPEGPHLYRMNGWYYLLIAEGGTEYGHMVTIARSTGPSGPFEAAPGNPIMSNRSTGQLIQATGHADLVQAHDGSWWAVMLGIRPVSRRHHLGRETCLAPVAWSPDGWPVAGNGAQLELEMEGPDFYHGPRPAEARLDHFAAAELQEYWSFLRNPYPADWSLRERQGWLTLHGSAVTLNDTDSPAFVACRQQHFRCAFSALLQFTPEDGDEAGLSVYMNELHHYEIALTGVNGQRYLLLRKRAGSIWMVAEQAAYAGDTVILRIQADRKGYSFSYQLPGEAEWHLLGHAESSLLSTEVAGGFTGVYLGMYATGNGTRAKQPAYFDWADYRIDE